MRKILLILLTSIHLLGNTELSELFKIQQLFVHYKEHRQNNPGIRFISFLSMHYLKGDDGTNTDNGEDEKLPCHDCKQEHSFSHSFSFTLSTPELEHSPALRRSEFDCRPEEGFSSDFVRMILQPPRA
ncbi:MAG TPA: hypothetical protein VFV31_00965 [Chitinophagaceae bacterium]|nr:hypothetical protein [Chitinophagaceae bacterium]